MPCSSAANPVTVAAAGSSASVAISPWDLHALMATSPTNMTAIRILESLALRISRPSQLVSSRIFLRNPGGLRSTKGDHAQVDSHSVGARRRMHEAQPRGVLLRRRINARASVCQVSRRAPAPTCATRPARAWRRCARRMRIARIRRCRPARTAFASRCAAPMPTVRPQCRSAKATYVAGCGSDADCGGNTPYCAASGACVACVSDAMCTTESAPVCDGSANTCRGCVADSECASGICLESNGTCADASSAVFVTVGGSDTGTCSQSAPCATMTYRARTDVRHEERPQATRLRVHGRRDAANSRDGIHRRNVDDDPWHRFRRNAPVSVRNSRVDRRQPRSSRWKRSRHSRWSDHVLRRHAWRRSRQMPAARSSSTTPLHRS